MKMAASQSQAQRSRVLGSAILYTPSDSSAASDVYKRQMDILPNLLGEGPVALVLKCLSPRRNCTALARGWAKLVAQVRSQSLFVP